MGAENNCHNLVDHSVGSIIEYIYLSFFFWGGDSVRDSLGIFFSRGYFSNHLCSIYLVGGNFLHFFHAFASSKSKINKEAER